MRMKKVKRTEDDHLAQQVGRSYCSPYCLWAMKQKRMRWIHLEVEIEDKKFHFLYVNLKHL